MAKLNRLIRGSIILFMSFFLFCGFCRAAEEPEITLLVLGSYKCLNCRLMEPIINDLREEYQGKVSMPYIDIVINRDQARFYKVNRLPTLILFDRNQREVFRHQGFLDRATLVKNMEQLLVREGGKQ